MPYSFALPSALLTGDWVLTFDDEFDDPSVPLNVAESGLFTHAYMTWGDLRTLPGNNEQELYVDSRFVPNPNGTTSYNADAPVGSGGTPLGIDPFSYKNGSLVISAIPTPISAKNAGITLPYLSGMINTEETFVQEYGYFEIRAKLPAGQGLWPAFWLVGANEDSQLEIDIMEALGKDTGRIYQSYHTGSVSGEHPVSLGDYSSGFHTYGVQWSPTALTFFVDGRQTTQLENPFDERSPAYMIANLAVGGTWGGNANSTTPFPAEMEIDYIRAYQNTAWNPGKPVPPYSSSPSSPPPSSTEVENVTVGSGADRLLLKISGDAYANKDGTSDAAGHAVFTVSVDGKQIGGTFTALAKHGSQIQTFSLNGNFGAGSHAVKVTFLNDAWNGTETTDRNLFVEAVSYRGTDTNQAATLMSNGVASFTVTGGTAPVGGAITSSPNNTVLRAGSTRAITDAAGNRWTIAGGKVAVNGSPDSITANVKALAFVNGKVWQENTSNLWWAKSKPSDIWSPSAGSRIAPINISVKSGGQTRTVDGTVAHKETDFGAVFNLTAPGVASIVLGNEAVALHFTSMSKVKLTAGKSASTVITDGGTHSFTAGRAPLTVSSGAGADSYTYHAGNARLTITDFAVAQGDTLTMDKALQGTMKIASDGQGGIRISFGTLGAGIDLKGVVAAPTTAFRWLVDTARG